MAARCRSTRLPASIPIASRHSPSATWPPRERSATPAQQRASSARTRTDPRAGGRGRARPTRRPSSRRRRQAEGVGPTAEDRTREVPARRPVSRVLSRHFRGGDGHPSGTPVARRLMRPTRGRGDAPLARPPNGRGALLFGLAPGRACPFHPARHRRSPAGSSLWRWSSPHGGRVLPATLRRGARTFLVPPPVARRGPRPSGRLAGTVDHRGPPTALRRRPDA